MRFNKGSQVEVLNNRKLSSMEWRCEKIISGNGHTYSVQHDCSSTTNEAIVERVPKKAIRPCPPLVKGFESWAANDTVEVYDADCWKGATVLKILCGDMYLVRLQGSSKELTVHKSEMRVCQSWQDYQWVIMRKGSGNCGAGKSIRNLSLKTLNSYKMPPKVQQAGTESKQQTSNDCLPGQDSSSLQEYRLGSSTTLKRVSPYIFSPGEAYTKKVRTTRNKGECRRFVAVSPPHLVEKVDAVAYPHENMAEKCMHAFFYNGSTRYYEMEEGNPNNVSTHCLERMKEPNDSCSYLCSVGSCSVMSNIPNKLPSDMLAGPCPDADTFSSDAASLDVTEEEGCPHSPKENVAARIHRLELNAYRSTLEAMYASGPLSWDQEALLTNLRISLHISNDEHLMEIRNLIYGGQHI